MCLDKDPHRDDGHAHPDGTRLIALIQTNQEGIETERGGGNGEAPKNWQTKMLFE